MIWAFGPDAILLISDEIHVGSDGSAMVCPCCRASSPEPDAEGSSEVLGASRGTLVSKGMCSHKHSSDGLPE